eukprot:CAMPEP_0178723596 /NCGR_PEP_ID=MMETSP0699-20121125/25637_1 /TAXON_ID=265572 /ORGANISM="Extubocellulus spinifer, Strain CCMP396" /LENGTH=62 /DNA_ID=CAMNT_0020374699 /DNA_START=42 /DNA_END=226 /DNA_ORIENTATION=-
MEYLSGTGRSLGYRSWGVSSRVGRPVPGMVMPVISRSIAAYAAVGRRSIKSCDFSRKLDFTT